MLANVVIFGAFDRFNYGDLLFPLILEKSFEKLGLEAELSFYGLQESDLRQYGAKATLPIQQLYTRKLSGKDSIVVAGGEVLGAHWFAAHSHLLKKPFHFVPRVVEKTIGRTSADALSRNLLGARHTWPWVVSPQDFGGNVKIIYNTVGGSTSLGRLFTEDASRAQEVLKEASYLSVRDRKTESILKTQGDLSNVVLAPDSAILMSEFFPFNKLNSEIKNKTRTVVDSYKEGYVAFQVNKHLGRKHLHSLIEGLENIYRRLGLPVVLLPIGRASGHEDQVILRAIAKGLSTPFQLPCNNIGIFDIMYIIANASCFAGTSLHGAVTALSFSVPHVGLTTEVPKLNNFLDTWDLPEHLSVEVRHLAGALERALNGQRARRDERRYALIGHAWQHMESVIKVIRI